MKLYNLSAHPLCIGTVDGLFYKDFFYEVRYRNFGMMTLVGFAITVSYFFSSIGIFLFGLQEQFFMEVVTLIDVMLFGHWIEMRAVMGASSELKSLARLLPSTAHKYMPDGTLTTVSIDTLHVEDHILVRPGEKIPADGIILEGESEINQAALTGETTPVYVKKGSPVIAGAIIQQALSHYAYSKNNMKAISIK